MCLLKRGKFNKFRVFYQNNKRSVKQLQIPRCSKAAMKFRSSKGTGKEKEEKVKEIQQPIFPCLDVHSREVKKQIYI